MNTETINDKQTPKTEKGNSRKSTVAAAGVAMVAGTAAGVAAERYGDSLFTSDDDTTAEATIPVAEEVTANQAEPLAEVVEPTVEVNPNDVMLAEAEAVEVIPEIDAPQETIDDVVAYQPMSADDVIDAIVDDGGDDALLAQADSANDDAALLAGDPSYDVDIQADLMA